MHRTSVRVLSHRPGAKGAVELIAIRAFDRVVGLCAGSWPELELRRHDALARERISRSRKSSGAPSADRDGVGGLTMTDNARLVIDLDRQRMTALKQMEIDKVKKFLSDELVWTHTSGRVDTKESQISSMESGEIVYSRYDPSDVKAQDYGDFVVLTGKADTHVNFRGTLYPLDVRFTDGWHRKDGKWKCSFGKRPRSPIPAAKTTQSRGLVS
jgi:uncharacterized protein DUF4440